MARQRLMTLHLGAGAYLSCTPPLSLQMKAECIYSPACHPAASGRGITLAMMNKQGLIQKQALAHPVTHSRTSRVHHAITAEVFCRVHAFVFVCPILPHCSVAFITPKKEWLSSWVDVRMVIEKEDLFAQMLQSRWVCFNKKWCLEHDHPIANHLCYKKRLLFSHLVL